MPATFFGEPRLAEVYDRIGSGDRRDLEPYLAMVDELGASSILDLGCGTGTFACLRAERGRSVTGVEPAAASIEVAKRKPQADRVRWMDDVGPVDHWLEATGATGRDMSFRWTFFFERDGAVFAWEATFRRRTRDEIAAAVASAGFVVEDVRDVPDRPGSEYVFVARRPSPGPGPPLLG